MFDWFLFNEINTTGHEVADNLRLQDVGHDNHDRSRRLLQNFSGQ